MQVPYPFKESEGYNFMKDLDPENFMDKQDSYLQFNESLKPL